MTEQKIENKITPEERKRLNYEKYLRKIPNTSRIKHEEFKSDIIQAYKNASMPPPKYVVGPFQCPYEMIAASAALCQVVEEKIGFKDEDSLLYILQEIVKKNVNESNGEKLDFYHETINFLWANLDVGAFAAFEEHVDNDSNKEKQAKNNKSLEVWARMSDKYSFFIPMNGIVLFSQNPIEFHLNNTNQLHNADGPALKYDSEYADKSNQYVYKNVTVPKHVIERKFSGEDILKEKNQEIRRVMIDLYDKERLVKDCDFEKVHTDNYGTLYKRNMGDSEEPVMVIHLIDSTQLPDGTYKEYFLRVDPNAYGGLKTARAAVASTWRNKDGSLYFENPEEYQPLIET